MGTMLTATLGAARAGVTASAQSAAIAKTHARGQILSMMHHLFCNIITYLSMLYCNEVRSSRGKLMTETETGWSGRHDHESCVADAIETAENICRERGTRLTPLRRKVLELIWSSHRPIGAYAVLG